MSLETSRERRARARVGQVLRDKWRLDALLGVGGMAAVYSATHRNGKRVAIKMLHPELSFDDEARVRFGREAYAANAIRHPGALTVHDDDVAEDGSAYLVMDLLEGETVEARRERKGGALSTSEVIWIADNVLDVLIAAHEKGVVHRDIKPDNVFLTTRSEVKILDFGLARLRELGASEKVTASYGQILGTPAYLPPEQAGGNWSDIDETTDVWAVGAMMFTLLTGRYVHEANSLQEMIMAAVTRSAPKVASVLPTVPPALAAVVDTALQRDKRARHPSARAMLAALRAAAQAFPGRITIGSLPPPSAARDDDGFEERATEVSEAKPRVVPVAASFAADTNPDPPRDEPAGPGRIAAMGSLQTPSALLLTGPPSETRPSNRLVPVLAIAMGALAALLLGLLLYRAPASKKSASSADVPVVAKTPPAPVIVEAPPNATSESAASSEATTKESATPAPSSTAVAKPSIKPARATSTAEPAVVTTQPTTQSTAQPVAPAASEDPMDRRR